MSRACILFDLDGTLCDTNGVDDECYRDAVACMLEIPATAVDWPAAPHQTDAGIVSRNTIFSLAFKKVSASSTEQAILVGDRDCDGVTSRELGWVFVGIGAGEHAGHLRSLGAKLVVSNYRDQDVKHWIDSCLA